MANEAFTFTDSGLAACEIAIPAVLAKYLEQIAKAIAKQAASNAPVRTGFLASSIYTSTKSGSTYGQNLAQGEPDSYLLPEIDRPTSDQEAWVAVGANYGVFVELGTVKMAAEPYLVPAVEAMQATFSQGPQDFEAQLAAMLGL